MANKPIYTPPVGMPSIPTEGPVTRKQNMLNFNRLQSRGRSQPVTPAAPVNPEGSAISKQSTFAELQKSARTPEEQEQIDRAALRSIIEQKYKHLYSGNKLTGFVTGKPTLDQLVDESYKNLPPISPAKLKKLSNDERLAKQADIAGLLAKLKKVITPELGAEWRSVEKAPGSLLSGTKLTPGKLYDPSTIHLIGNTPLQRRLLTGLDYATPAITAGTIQTATGGLDKQPGESWSDYALRTSGAAATGLATSPVGLATTLKRVGHGKFFSGHPDMTTSTMKGLLAPLLTKATVGAVGLAPSLYSDIKKFTGSLSGTAQNVEKGTDKLDLSGAVKRVGEGAEGLAGAASGIANSVNEVGKGAVQAITDQGKSTTEAVKPISDLAGTANKALKSIGDNWGWAAGGAGVGLGSILLAKRLMAMRENLAREKTKQMAMSRPNAGKKRKLTIDPGDYDFEIKNFQVNPETHGLY